MTGELTNHLWQSTLFALAAGLLTTAFRGNKAQVRHWLWFSASLKFLLPFALLMSLGSDLHRTPSLPRMPRPPCQARCCRSPYPFPPTRRLRFLRGTPSIGLRSRSLCGRAGSRQWRRFGCGAGSGSALLSARAARLTCRHQSKSERRRVCWSRVLSDSSGLSCSCPKALWNV